MVTCTVSHVSREANHMQLVFDEPQASLCASRGIGSTCHTSNSFSLVTPTLVSLAQSKLTFTSHREVNVSSRWPNCLLLPPCSPPRTPQLSSWPSLTSRPSSNPSRKPRSPSHNRWPPCSSTHATQQPTPPHASSLPVPTSSPAGEDPQGRRNKRHLTYLCVCPVHPHPHCHICGLHSCHSHSTGGLTPV